MQMGTRSPPGRDHPGHEVLRGDDPDRDRRPRRALPDARLPLSQYVRQTAGTATSTADELSKLADLRDRGTSERGEHEGDHEQELIAKPGRTRRYHLEPQNAGSIAALLTLREQVIAPILAGVRSPRMGRKPVTWAKVDRDYEKIRIDMQTLFQDLGIRAAG